MTKSNKAPAFQFYAAEFLSDENVVLMTNQEVGCYIKLMAYCWREGSIPADVAKIARLCGENGSAMAQLWIAIGSCFAVAEGNAERLVHPRLEKERVKQKEHAEERAASGKKGAQARWNKAHGVLQGMEDGDSSAMNQSMANDASSSSSSSSKSSSPTGKKTDSAARFDAQAHLVSLGVGKQHAKDWLKARKAKNLAPTLSAIELAQSEAEKLGWDFPKAIEYAAGMGWGGFKSSWVLQEQAKDQGGGKPGAPALTKAEAVVAKNAGLGDALAAHMGVTAEAGAVGVGQTIDME
jgi:uncharacterized protein YdaU (DUF1376 family)